MANEDAGADHDRAVEVMEIVDANALLAHDAGAVATGDRCEQQIERTFIDASDRMVRRCCDLKRRATFQALVRSVLVFEFDPRIEMLLQLGGRALNCKCLGIILAEPLRKGLAVFDRLAIFNAVSDEARRKRGCQIGRAHV